MKTSGCQRYCRKQKLTDLKWWKWANSSDVKCRGRWAVSCQEWIWTNFLKCWKSVLHDSSVLNILIMSDSCSGGERLGVYWTWKTDIGLEFLQINSYIYCPQFYLFFFLKAQLFLSWKSLDQKCKSVFKRLNKQHKNQTKTNNKALLVKAICLKYVSSKGLLKSSLVHQLMIGL